MNLVEPNLEMYAGDEKERSLLAWILYALARGSALSREMSEIGGTLSCFLMRRSMAIVPGLTAYIFFVVKEVSQPKICLVAAVFLVSMARGVKSGRVAHLQGMLSDLNFSLVKSSKKSCRCNEISSKQGGGSLDSM
jgi:hypothetical protein